MANTLAPIEEPYAPEIADALSKYPEQDGYILSLFRTFANSLRFLKKGVPNLLDKASPLPLRIREIIILRVTANNNCEYEWGVHIAVFAKAARLSEQQVSATCTAKIDPDLWSAREACLLLAIDTLCADGCVGDEVIDQFQCDWTLEQQIEILALCGAYHTVSFVANTARLPGEAFGVNFPNSAVSQSG